MFHHCQFPDLPEGWNDDTCLILDCEPTKPFCKINLCLSWGICYSKYKANTLNNCSFLVSYWFLFLCLTSKYFTDTELFSMLPTFFPCKGNFTKSYGSNTIYILIVTNFYFPSEPFHWISDSNQLIQHLHSMSNTCLYPNTELLSNHWQNTFLLNSSLSL